MFDKNIFCERLLNLRKENNLNQTELAEKVGISYHTISKIENKQRAASIELIYDLAIVFDVSLDYLMGRNSNPQSHKL